MEQGRRHSGSREFLAREVGGRHAKLSKFKLQERALQVEGGITLAKGELSSARFNTVKLNRGDDVSLVMRRSGKGYEST